MNQRSIAFISELSTNFVKLEVPKRHVLQVSLNKPKNLNAMTIECWIELQTVFKKAHHDTETRAIVLSAQGSTFSAGIDLLSLKTLLDDTEHLESARAALKMRKHIFEFQQAFQALEKCHKPIIASVQGPCIGGGIDLVCAADIRYCSATAWFQIKEIEVGLAADLGTLQLLPKVVGSASLARELIFTGRRFLADEALHSGFVSRVLETPEESLNAAIATAELIAERSPIAVQTSKSSVIYSRDHSVADGLDHIADLNQVMLQGVDIKTAVMAAIQKTKPSFDDA